LNLGNWNLPFDPAQGGGELVELFVICDLEFGILITAALELQLFECSGIRCWCLLEIGVNFKCLREL
jgi:hypothetical protein